MAIHEEVVTDIQGGMTKEIEVSARDLMYDILQRFQYQFPIKSAIRELVSNGLDAITERNNAIKILTGEATVEDFYVEKEGDLYRDSKFDPSYYSLDHLSIDPFVRVTYIVGSGTEKDQVVISDKGVGLGGNRLFKFFNLGYSSKRLSKSFLGKFGLGNKSALAINPMYTMSNVYNGKYFKFNIYSTKFQSLIPRFNLETGKENGHILFPGSTEPIYYLDTNEMNGLSIYIEAKKHHKDQYLSAVKDQLMYFDNVELSVVEGGSPQVKNFKAEIMYEDEYLVLAKNQVWAKPHILLNKVNYGFIDFDELELEHKNGSIGIKLLPENVEVNPSRESLIWNEKTKEAVLERFKDAVNVASNLIQQELTSKDFIEWLFLCTVINSRYSRDSNTVVGRLANIVSLDSVKPRFSAEPKLKYSPSLLNTLSIRNNKVITKRKTDTKNIRTVDRVYMQTLPTQTPIYLVTGDQQQGFRKDKYLCSISPTGHFVTIKEPEWLAKTGPIDKSTVSIETIKFILQDFGEWRDLLSKIDAYVTVRRAKNPNYVYKRDDLIKQYGYEELERVELAWKHLCLSSKAQYYDAIEVPESFVGSNEEEEELKESKEAEERATAVREARRVGKEILMKSFTGYGGVANLPYGIPPSYIDTWVEDEIYVANNTPQDMDLMRFIVDMLPDLPPPIEETEDTPRRALAAEHCLKYGLNHRLEYNLSTADFFFNTPIKLVVVAQKDNKYFINHKHPTQFFSEVRNNVLTMSNHLIRWNTARKIHSRLAEVSFLFNFPLAPKRQEEYLKFADYVDLHYKPLGNRPKETMDVLLKHLQAVEEFQIFVQTTQDPVQIAALAQELWSNNDIVDAQAIDYKLWSEFLELVSWASGLAPLCNNINIFTGIELDNDSVGTGVHIPLVDRLTPAIPQDFEFEIRKIAQQKGVDLQ